MPTIEVERDRRIVVSSCLSPRCGRISTLMWSEQTTIKLYPGSACVLGKFYPQWIAHEQDNFSLGLIIPILPYSNQNLLEQNYANTPRALSPFSSMLSQVTKHTHGQGSEPRMRRVIFPMLPRYLDSSRTRHRTIQYSFHLTSIRSLCPRVDTPRPESSGRRLSMSEVLQSPDR
jgi:hypothetical protein